MNRHEQFGTDVLIQNNRFIAVHKGLTRVVT
jgi:hypothetical protein